MPGAVVPNTLRDAPRYVLDDDVLAEPGPLAQVLHRHWARRRPTVVELGITPADLQQRETTTLAPWELGPDFCFERERLAHRVWANAYDLRHDEPVWWRGEIAARRFELRRDPPDGIGDVVLPDGRSAWIDGGPRGPVAGVGAPIVHRESIELLGRLDVDGDGPLADDLTAEQHAAAVHRAGAARVLAPAGAGKTRVMTARLRHLVGPRGIQPELVTAVAYNRRAADELAGRVADDRVAVRTIHSLAYAICREAGIRTVLDERAMRSLLDSLVRFPRIQNADPAQPWLDALAAVRIGLETPADVAARDDDVAELPSVLPQLRAALAERRAVDFDEQVTRAIELLCTDPQLRDRWRSRCTHLLVDEFQDLAPAYVLLLRLVATPDLQVFGVGDDDQVVYGHAGADPRFLLEFDALFPGAADHRLAVNHRCPAGTVERARTLLGHNRRRVAKRISAAPGADDGGFTLTTVPRASVAPTVVTHVRGLLEEGVAPADVAVLSRVNSALLPTQVLLATAGVPTTAPLSDSVLSRTGTAAALAYLRVATDPDSIHPGDLHLTVKRPSRGLTGVLREHVVGRGRWSIDRVEDIGRLLGDAQAGRLADYVADLRLLATAAADGADAARLLRLVRTAIGLGEAMDGLDRAGQLHGSSHGDDLAALEQLAGAFDGPPAELGFWVRDALRIAGDPAGVHLSSVHRVKGEEWPHVVVAPVVEGLLPHRLADDVEEERRVLHVAITRGSASTTVVAAADAVSPFVAQLDQPSPTPGGAPLGDLDELVDVALPAPPGAAAAPDGPVTAAVGRRVGLRGGLRAVVDEVDTARRTALARVVEPRGAGTDAADTEVLHPTGARLRLVLEDHPGLTPTRVTVDGRDTTLAVQRPSRSRRAPAVGRDAPGLFEAGLAAHADGGVVDSLEETLRRWRTDTARSLGKPAYTVFDNKTLRAIAERQPRDERELLDVRGVGPAKLDQFGDDVLAAVRDATGT